jgi:hypothetical protein
MNKYLVLFLCSVLLLPAGLSAQSHPVGMPVLEEYTRRQQLLGDTTILSSLLIRPSFGIPATVKGAEFKLMPVVWRNQYTTDHPMSLNNGAMIPARGYQTLLSAGFFARYGIVSVQLMPELVYARNRYFDGLSDKHRIEVLRFYNSWKYGIDLPERFGTEPYKRAFWGQSSVRLTYKSVSMGISNENLWWGPGHKNALMMTNNAPGFKHFTFNTVKPVKTPIGSFEWQMVGGKLEGSGFPGVDTTLMLSHGVKPRKRVDDWLYFNGLTVNYQPRWLPGLSLGGARSFTIYSKKIKPDNYKTWLPVAEPFLKVNAGGHGYDTIPTDQLVSVWARWLMPKDHAEVYFEFGRSDHNWHLNDFLLEPTHNRAYILGYRKLVPLNDRRKSHLDVELEITQFSYNVQTLLRPYSSWGNWYFSGQHGFTNQGQIIGAGIGTSSNMQSVNVAWVNGRKRIGLELYRLNHDDDFWAFLRLNGGKTDYRTHWVDMSGAVVADWDFDRFFVNAKFQTIGALNYMFLYDPVLTEPPYFWDYGKTRYNFNLELNVGVWIR